MNLIPYATLFFIDFLDTCRLFNPGICFVNTFKMNFLQGQNDTQLVISICSWKIYVMSSRLKVL